METPPRRRCAGKLLAVLIGILFAAALIEGGLALAAHRGLHLGPPPSYEPDHPFWDSDHTAFGIWHHPNARWEHTVPCFSVTYESNSQGARDVEREIVSDAPRVIVLGDSIAEGWGLPLAERFSGVLERETGVEHLNFAMSHFSPYQQYLVYRDLAKRYSHDATIVTVSSINDFIDLDAALATGRYAYEYSYRPYLVPEGGSFHHVERRESTLRRLLRHYTYTFPAINRVRRTIRDRLDPPSPVPRRFSNFYDFEERAFAILERTLELIAEEMGGKLLFVVLLPFPQDMHRYEADGPDPLSARLAAFAERTGARIVNLLPAMYAKSRSHTGRWNRYVFDCDVHWNALAHATAAYTIRATVELFAPRLVAGGVRREVQSRRPALDRPATGNDHLGTHRSLRYILRARPLEDSNDSFWHERDPDAQRNHHRSANSPSSRLGPRMGRNQAFGRRLRAHRSGLRVARRARWPV